MSQLQVKELRLTSVIHEARDLLQMMKAHREALSLQQAYTPPTQKTLKLEIAKTLKDVLATEISLKAAVNEANQLANKIDGHGQWKSAVFELFGAEGLTKCFAYFKEQEEKLKR